MSAETTKRFYCSFCGDSQDACRVLIVAEHRESAICDRCAEIATLTIGDYYRERQMTEMVKALAEIDQ